MGVEDLNPSVNGKKLSFHVFLVCFFQVNPQILAVVAQYARNIKKNAHILILKVNKPKYTNKNGQDMLFHATGIYGELVLRKKSH